MSFANRVVCTLLESRAHRLLSGSTDVIRYRGRRSGRTFETPTQYATYEDGLVIFVARPDDKTWWRNFRVERDLDVLVAGSWRSMSARAILAAEEPEVIRPLLDAYVRRFPKAARLLASPDGGADRSEGNTARGSAVVVWCHPADPADRGADPTGDMAS